MWAGEASDSWLMVVVMSEGGKWSFLGLHGGILSVSARFPACPRLGAGASLLQEAKHILDALRVGEDFGERSRQAVGREVPSACGCV